MKLEPEQITVICDSREQWPFNLSPMRMEVDGLATGDYSVRGLENHVVVERKELGDFVSCVGSGRDRFRRELLRMQAYQNRAVVIEATWGDLTSGNYRSRMNPESVTSSIASWSGEFAMPFMLLGDRASAERFTQKFLFHSARRWFERAEAFRAAMEGVGTEK